HATPRYSVGLGAVAPTALYTLSLPDALPICIILGTAETEIASKFVEAAERYSESPVALNLRAMNMLYESIVKRGSLMVVPSGLADSLNLPGIMGMAGAAGLGAEGAPEVAAGGED